MVSVPDIDSSNVVDTWSRYSVEAGAGSQGVSAHILEVEPIPVLQLRQHDVLQ